MIFICEHCQKETREPQPEIVIPKCKHCGSKDVIPKNERECIELNHKEMLLLKEALEIRDTKCHYCKKEIKPHDKFSIFNKPTRVICHNIICIMDAYEEDE